MSTRAAAAWDAEYASGRYRGEPPVAFARDIIDAARSRNLRRGPYIGCGNGRNFIPMSEAGLDLVGLDISAQAVAQLRQRRPAAAGLIVGGLGAVAPSARFELGALTADGFTAVLPPRLDSTPHAPPGRGQWSQWEAIWQRRRPA